MAFKTENVITPKEKCPYELMVIDSDTPLLTAAKMVQTDYVLVKHIASGHVQRFKNVTEFHGHWKSKSGGALKVMNDKRIAKGQEPLSVDDFEIEECAELNTEITDHLNKAIESFDFFVGRMKRLNFADDYLLVIGGQGNFRKTLGKTLPYKGKRSVKPLLFAEVKEAIIQKYKRKIHVCDDEEADDVCSILAYKDYLNFLETGQKKIVLGYVDKDLKMCLSDQFNYGDSEPVIVTQTIEEATKHFCSQLLSGDLSTDNILGLPNFSDDVREKYKLGKTRGIGRTTAEKYLSGCATIKEMFERVVEAYRGYYGDDKKPFLSWDGNTYEWNWLDYLQDSALMLWLRREEGELYSIEEVLKELEIKYES